MKRDSSTIPVVLVILATLFGTMEMTVVVTALPTIGRTFPWAIGWLPWLTIASLMAAAGAMPLGGRMADEVPARLSFSGWASSRPVPCWGAWSGGRSPKSMGLLMGLRALQGFGWGIFAPAGDEPKTTPKTTLDLAGVVAVSGLLVAVMVALTLGRQAGFASPLVVALLVAGAALALVLTTLSGPSRGLDHARGSGPGDHGAARDRRGRTGGAHG